MLSLEVHGFVKSLWDGIVQPKSITEAWIS